MRAVFEPSNALEGHMLHALLEQRGISSRVEGAQLQGGVGELPVSGFVRLIVEDDDYERARAVITEWESTAVPDPIPVPPHRPARGIRGALIGLALGIAGSYAFFRAPLPGDGIDHNDDGKLDERWFDSVSGTTVKVEFDRNFDGDVDSIYHYDRRGRALLAESDDDFDGIFETQLKIHRGSIEVMAADTNGDSHVDLRSNLKHGVLVSKELLVPGIDQPIRVEHFRLGRVIAAEVDTDRDGHLDSRYKYSDTGELTGTEKIGSATARER